MRLLLLLIPMLLYGKNVTCPGYVFDKEIDNYLFTGQCNEKNTPVWGVGNYGEGASYQGFYDDEGRFTTGILIFSDGDYYIGRFNSPGEILSKKYISLGTYVYSDGGYTEAYFDENLSAQGFGVTYFQEGGYTMGMISNGFPNGLKVDRYEDEGYSIYGSVTNSKLNGLTFQEYDDGSSFQQYVINDQNVGEITSTEGSAVQQLDGIKQFLSVNYADLMIEIEKIENTMEEYYQLIEEADAQIEATTKISKFASKRSLIVKSAQELLNVLGYLPGRADGILGPLTNAAITAFKEDQNLDGPLEADESLLVELQKQVRKESYAKNNNLSSNEPEISGSGTGFFVNESSIVTNQHVIEGCAYLTDSINTKLDIVTIDRLNDLAILKTPSKSKKYIYLDSDPELGEEVYVAGFPYSFETLNFTSGAISALVGPEKNITQFQLTAPIQPGNSGGPILNNWGSLIGVTFARIDDMYILENSGTIPQNINYGIKLDVVRDILVENNIEFSEGRKYWFKPYQEDVAQLAKETTILINCYK